MFENTPLSVECLQKRLGPAEPGAGNVLVQPCYCTDPVPE